MTIEMSSFAALLIPLLLVFLSYGCISSKAKDAQFCSARWCGIHNVSHPFRLQDSPDHCGDFRYNLSCEDNRLVLYWKSGKYYVLSINYYNRTIRLVDANIGLHDYSYYSLPPYSLTSYNFTYREAYEYYYPSTNVWIYLMCPHRVASSDLYIDDTATCMNSSYAVGSTFYVNVKHKSLRDMGLGDSCRIELMYITSWPAGHYRSNISCTDIHHMLLYGFEISWLNSVCSDLSGYGLVDQHNNAYCSKDAGLTRLQEFRIIVEDLWWYIGLAPFQIFGRVTLQMWELIGFSYVAAKFVLGVPFIIILFIYKWRRRHLSMYESIEYFLQSDNNIMPIRYSYKDIKKITGGFKIKLGNGGYGSVFRGQLRSGRLVAVKLLDKAKANGQDFINEVATIGRIHHVNVVQLIGFCVEGSKRALIYEFMENGSLEKYIFSHEKSSSLSCEKLYTISLGVARGIEYLHNGCNMKILHFDIKPHNILLDENFNPKVSDFGLARLYPTDNSIVSLTAARGTIGYMAPELFYRNVGTISYKADVYSFGMLLMEMASRRKNLNAVAEHSSQIYFPFWLLISYMMEKKFQLRMTQ